MIGFKFYSDEGGEIDVEKFVEYEIYDDFLCYGGLEGIDEYVVV